MGPSLIVGVLLLYGSCEKQYHESICAELTECIFVGLGLRSHHLSQMVGLRDPVFSMIFVYGT